MHEYEEIKYNRWGNKNDRERKKKLSSQTETQLRAKYIKDKKIYMIKKKKKNEKNKT